MSELRTYDIACAWQGADIATDGDWVHVFTETEITELAAAAEAVLDADILDLTGADFHLPSLDSMLSEVRRDIVDGRGFVLLRGLPVREWPLEMTARAYWAIGSRIGVPISQNRVGNLLGHVTDVGGEADHHNQRGHQSSDALAFHTDISAEIVSLLCLHGARSGGASALASAVAVWNALVAEHPELAAVLTETVCFDRRNEVVDGQDPWYEMPVFFPRQGHVMASFVPEFIRSAQRFASVPRLTSLHDEAFDAVKSIANDPRFKLEMDFQPGDIQFVNNLVVLHSRTEYEDWPEAERRRHLLRLWLAVPDGWPIPEPLQARHGMDPDTGRPRGVNLEPGAALSAPLTPPVLRT